jgi:carbonic anhydrase
LSTPLVVAGSKLIVVLGHTTCGAVKGVIYGVEPGNLSAMLNNVDDAVARADEAFDGPTSSSNVELVNATVVGYFSQTVKDILAGSTAIAELE